MSKVKPDEFGAIREFNVDLKARTIYLCGTVGDSINFIDFDMAMTKLESVKKTVTVKLFSVGGCVYEAHAIAGRILKSKCKVAVEVYGQVCSSALSILAVARWRSASRMAEFMHHDAATSVSGRVGVIDNFMKAMQQEEIRRFRWLGEFTKRSADWWKAKAAPEFYFNAEEAKDIGLIDEIF